MTSVLESAAPAAVAAAERARQPLKIGIVSPYGYPHPGGVNEHVRFTYEAMRRMGHDVWIITSKYGRERESEGDVIRLGTGWAAPANGSVGRVTLGLRFKRQVREVLAAQHFDVLHFHEPLVPFLSPTMLDASKTVNIATFHAFGGFSPSYWIGSKFAGRLADKLDGRIAVVGRGAPLHQPLLPRRVPDHPQRGRPGALPGRRAIRGAARRHAEHPLRRSPRGAKGPHSPAPGLPPAAEAQGGRAPARGR